METSELLFKSMVGVMVATGKQAVIIKYVEVLTIFYFFALQPWGDLGNSNDEQQISAGDI